MKTKAFRAKIMLNKLTIANLDHVEMRHKKAGNGTPRGTNDGWCAEMTKGAFCLSRGNVCAPTNDQDCTLQESVCIAGFTCPC